MSPYPKLAACAKGHAFTPDNTRLDAKGARVCKTCQRGHVRRHRRRTVDQRRSQIQELRIQALLRYGGVCVCCGETEIAFLVFDHVNDDGFEDRKRIARGSTWYRHLAHHPLREDIQVLCSNCNMAKAYAPGGCPHQVQARQT